jgi:hypothetical protein
LPFALGLVTGVLAGPRWQDPVRASVLLAAALAVADIIPFTIDTMALANLSDERIVSMVRERLDAKIFAMIPPAELRAGPAKIRAQAVEVWILLWPLRLGISGGLTVLGALVGRRLGRGRQRVAPSDAVGGASA